MIRNFALAVAAASTLATTSFAQETSSVPLGDEVFLMKAYCEGMAEVAKSKLACERATQGAIKMFAEQMVKDHTECNTKIAEVARQKGIPLSAAPSAPHIVALTRLAKMTGSDFDKAYMKAQMCAHVEAIRLFEHESCKGEDSEIKTMATHAIPKLQGHAKEAFEIAGEKAEYQKFCKVQDYAKQVMADK